MSGWWKRSKPRPAAPTIKMNQTDPAKWLNLARARPDADGVCREPQSGHVKVQSPVLLQMPTVLWQPLQRSHRPAAPHAGHVASVVSPATAKLCLHRKQVAWTGLRRPLTARFFSGRSILVPQAVQWLVTSVSAVPHLVQNMTYTPSRGSAVGRYDQETRSANIADAKRSR